MLIQIYVTLKKDVLDPQGDAVVQALHSLGYSGVDSVRQGKFFELELKDVSNQRHRRGEGEAPLALPMEGATQAPSIELAQKQVREMCEKLLANTVIEEYRFEIVS